MDEKALARILAMSLHMQCQISAIAQLFLEYTSLDQRSHVRSRFLELYDRNRETGLGTIADQIPHLTSEYLKTLDTLRETSLPFVKPEAED